MKLSRTVISRRTAEYVLWAIALAYLVVYLVIALTRMSYPFELEWMEGAVVDHVRWILAGRQPYVEPSIEFVPFPYNPLYYYVCAAFSKFLGVGFFPLRLVSFLSSIGTILAIYWFVKNGTGSATGGVLAVGLFAAAFRAGGAWYDVARMDSLFIFLLLAGVYLLLHRNSVGGHVVAGVLVSLSFLTKQTALAVAVPLAICCVICLPRRLKAVFPVTFFTVAAAGALVLNAASGGWYRYYAFGSAGYHEYGGRYYWKFWTHDLLGCVPVALAFSLLYLVGVTRGSRSANAKLYWVFFVSMVGTAWVSRLHMGGYDNVLIPAYVAIAVGFGLGAGVLFPANGRGSGTVTVDSLGGRSGKLHGLVVVLCAAQLVFLSYDPREQIPTEADREAGRQLVRILEAIDGEILMPHHGYLPALAGKRTSFHEIALWDVLRAGDPTVANRFLTELSDALRDGRYRAIVIDRGLFDQIVVPSHYVATGKIFEDDVFWPVTGKRTRPETVLELVR
jgi:hypothetical protein